MPNDEDNGFIYDFGRALAWGSFFAVFWGGLTFLNDPDHAVMVTAVVFVSVVGAVGLAVQRERHKRINQAYELMAKRR